MRFGTISWLIVGMGSVLAVAHAADTSGDPSGLWKKLPAIYKIHSGIVSDRTPPTSSERRLTINVDGKAAKDIFDSIGPDSPSTCSNEKGDRDRRKKGVWCVYTAQDSKTKGGPYQCWIGVDLKTGETISTVSC